MNCKSATLRITQKCNDNCNFCYQELKNEENLTLNEIICIIEKLSSSNVNTLMISGGEPLLFENITEVIKYSGDKGMKTLLATNGISLSKQMLEQLDDSGLGEIYVSVGDLSDQVKVGRLRKIMKVIQQKDEMKLKLGVNLIVTRSFLTNANERIKVLLDIGVDKIYLIPPKRSGNIEWYEKERLDLSYYYILCRYIQLWKHQFSLVFDCALTQVLGIITGDASDTECSCPGGTRGMNIDYDGEVYACGYFTLDQFTGGNILDQCLNDIMASDGFKLFIHTESESKDFFPICMT